MGEEWGKNILQNILQRVFSIIFPETPGQVVSMSEVWTVHSSVQKWYIEKVLFLLCLWKRKYEILKTFFFLEDDAGISPNTMHVSMLPI